MRCPNAETEELFDKILNAVACASMGIDHKRGPHGLTGTERQQTIWRLQAKAVMEVIT